MVEFRHPLARSACLRPAHSLDGTVRFILVIVTTLELDHRHNGYKKPFVDRLSRAAREHVARLPKVEGFVLMNRPRDW
jgi:hypothetical protein